MSDLRYSRPFTLCIEALYTLCCERGEIRSRLALIDKEFFMLRQEDFPDFDGLRSDVEVLRKGVTKLNPTGNEGQIEATISRAKLGTLQAIAQRIWDINRKFNAFMNRGA